MAIVAAPIAAAADREPLPDAGVGGALRQIGRARSERRRRRGRARRRHCGATRRCIAHQHRQVDRAARLDGRASGDVLARLAAGVAVDAPVDERKAAMGGVKPARCRSRGGPRGRRLHVRRRHACRCRRARSAAQASRAA
jgi:hypothetical protein